MCIIGGWQAEGIFTGTPVTPSQSSRPTTRGQTAAGLLVASLVSGQNPFAKTPGYAFNINAFEEAPVGTFGNSSNNMLRGLGMNNTDFSLIKNTTIHESLGFQLRFEAFNVFNESDLGPFPGLSLATPAPSVSSLLYRTGGE